MINNIMKTKIYVNSEYFDSKDFTKWLDNKKYELYDITKDKDNDKNIIDFIYIDATTKKNIKDRIYKNVKVGIMSYVILNISFFDKYILHEYVEKKDKVLFETYFLKQQVVSDDILKTLKKDKTYIIKPIPGFAGDGIKVFKGSDGMREHIDIIEKRTKKRDKWIVQDYIEEPLLLKGKKFHMRIMILLTGGNAYFYKDFLVYPARKEFSLDDLSVEVHDTHGTLTESYEKSMFPAEYTNMAYTKEIYIQIANLFIGLRKNGLFDHKCYKESEKCYQLFGADIMITKDYQVKCLEINYKPGLTNFLKRMPNLVKGILDLTLLGKKEGEGYYRI